MTRGERDPRARLVHCLILDATRRAMRACDYFALANPNAGALCVELTKTEQLNGFDLAELPLLAVFCEGRFVTLLSAAWPVASMVDAIREGFEDSAGAQVLPESESPGPTDFPGFGCRFPVS